jgi:hypothetical protein
MEMKIKQRVACYVETEINASTRPKIDADSSTEKQAWKPQTKDKQTIKQAKDAPVEKIVHSKPEEFAITTMMELEFKKVEMLVLLRLQRLNCGANFKSNALPQNVDSNILSQIFPRKRPQDRPPLSESGFKRSS